MRIHLLKNNSENNKLGKNTTYIDALEGTLRAGTSLLNPIFEIALENYLDLQQLLDITYPDDSLDIDIMYVDNDENIDVDAYSENISIFDVNYIYIEEFKRYYFVKDINIINSKLFILSCECDVLDSHKDELLVLDALIERNEFLYNNLLEDNMASYLYDKDITLYNLDTIGCVLLSTTINSNPNTMYQAYNIIWATMTDGDDVDNISPGIDMNVSSTQQGFAKGENINALQSHLDLEELVKVYIKNDVKLSYLKHLTVYPFQSNFLGATSHGAIKINNHEYTEIMNWKDVEIVTEKVLIGTFDFHKTPFEDYTYFAPYTKYELYIPYYGYVDLNAEDINGSLLEVYYLVNYLTGEATANITAVQKGKTRLLFTSACQLGTKIPLNSTNAYEIEKEKDALIMSTSIGVISNTMQIALGWASYNPMMMASGGMGMASTLGNAFTKANQFYVSGKIDTSKAVFNNFNPLKPHLKKTTLIKNNDNADFEKYYGKPLNEVKNLSTLSGYTKVADIHLENVSALDGEKSAIESLLKTGIII